MAACGCIAPLPREEIARRVEAYHAAVAEGHVPRGFHVGTGKRSACAVAAERIGIDVQAMKWALGRAGRYGLEPASIPADARPPEGFHVKERVATYDGQGRLRRQSIRSAAEPGAVFRPLKGHIIKGESALVDLEGRLIAKWQKTKLGEVDPLAVAKALRRAFARMPAAAPAPAPQPDADGDLMTLYPFGDWHLGMFAWGRETAANWDLKIAETTIVQAVRDLVSSAPPAAEAVVLGGGDLLHADNADNRTARSGHALDVDGRYPKVVEAAGRIKVAVIDAALSRHRLVRVRILPGNHDEHTAIAITYFLAAWYRNEPRVLVDTSPGLFWWHRFGLNLLGGTHGHTVKIDQMPAIMAHRRAEDWGATKHRFVHGFHLHHHRRIATELNGVICEVHQTPIPQDAWHFGAGFLSGRSVQCITYHRDKGERFRTRLSL